LAPDIGVLKLFFFITGEGAKSSSVKGQLFSGKSNICEQGPSLIKSKGTNVLFTF
jgi:hypothetical protein